jgi:hypothetical protein
MESWRAPDAARNPRNDTPDVLKPLSASQWYNKLKYMKKIFYCILCSVIVYEAYLGERHTHAPEQQYSTNPPVSSAYLVSSASIGTTPITKTLSYAIRK